MLSSSSSLCGIYIHGQPAFLSIHLDRPPSSLSLYPALAVSLAVLSHLEISGREMRAHGTVVPVQTRGRDPLGKSRYVSVQPSAPAMSMHVVVRRAGERYAVPVISLCGRPSADWLQEPKLTARPRPVRRNRIEEHRRHHRLADVSVCGAHLVCAGRPPEPCGHHRGRQHRPLTIATLDAARKTTAAAAADSGDGQRNKEKKSST